MQRIVKVTTAFSKVLCKITKVLCKIDKVSLHIISVTHGFIRMQDSKQGCCAELLRLHDKSSM